jgi:hypothetical protein
MHTAILFVLAFLLQTPAAVPANMFIQAELKKEITSRRSHPGQDVWLVVTEDLRAQDGSVLIPLGAKLSGKVSVARKRSGDDPAALSFVVNKAEWKNGSMPLNATIEVLQLMGMPSESAACGPNLNRASMAACGGSNMMSLPVPADCAVEALENDSQKAIVCRKREVVLGQGAVVVFKTAKP